MKAAVCEAYGGPDVVRVREVAKPVARDGEVLIRVLATTVSSGDARVRGSNFPPGFWIPVRLALGLTRPRNPILGVELAGVVEFVGTSVTRYRPGDEVFAMSSAGFGCHAEYKTIQEAGAIALKPSGMSFEDTAAIAFGGTTALYFLRDAGKVQRGERVVINGASGTVGTAAIQIARHLGAHVTAVCSAANAKLVRSLGADTVIDYTAVNFTSTGELWDVILDAAGTAPFARSRRAMTSKGRLLVVLGSLGAMVKAPFQSISSGLKVVSAATPERAEDLNTLKALCEAGDFRPVIDSRFPFDQIAGAHARVDTGRKAGSVVVTLQ